MNFNFKKIIYIILAFLFLGIGFIGVMLPVLPTVPFLLLSSYLFTKSSDRLNNWFMETKIYQNHLEEFVENKSMTLKQKFSILLPVSTILIVTFYLMNNIHIRIAIVFTFIAKYVYFFTRIKTVDKCKVCLNEKVSVQDEFKTKRSRA